MKQRSFWITLAAIAGFCFCAGLTLEASALNNLQYQTLPLGLPALGEVTKNQVLVTEFFSLECPHCYRAQAPLKAWLLKTPQVVFQQIPVGLGNPAWTTMAKTYYVLKALGKLDEGMPLIFKAIHEDHRLLFDEESLANFLTQAGISKEKFKEYFESFSINQELQASDQLAMAYGIIAVPTFIVGNRYVTDPLSAGSEAAMVPVLGELVDQFVKINGTVVGS